HSRRLGERHSACSLGCEFSEGTIRSRSEVSTSHHPPTRQFDLEQTRPFQRGCLCSSTMMSTIFWGALWSSLSRSVSGPTCVLLFGHRNAVHDQKVSAASLAFLPRHENVIEQRSGFNSGFLLAVRADHTISSVSHSAPNAKELSKHLEPVTKPVTTPKAALRGGFALLIPHGSEDHGVTVKTVALVAVPPAVVILILPVSAPVGTLAVTCVLLFTMKLVAFAPNVTFVVPVKPVPVITTFVPTEPLIGAKLVIVGKTRNFRLLVSMPPGVVTVTKPFVAAL